MRWGNYSPPHLTGKIPPLEEATVCVSALPFIGRDVDGDCGVGGGGVYVGRVIPSARRKDGGQTVEVE